MPSAANAKSEKPASSEATDNSPIRQIMTLIEHKIRNLEKRKGKLTQYRDWQKAGKELNSDQRVAVAKYDEVVQTLEFARDIAKQIATIATMAERDAKKQAKKDAWVRNAMETSKIREVLLILDCLTQMGSNEAREDFLNGTNGAAKLTEDDLKILDDLYPEVTPKHEPNEEGQAGFHPQASKAAEHLCSIIDGKPKEILGTTYTRIKEIIGTVHECGYFDRVEVETVVEMEEIRVEEQPEVVEPEPEPEIQQQVYPPAGALPVPPAPAVVPAPAYPLRPLPPITLQEVEHAYFAQQYPQQRPIAEVIGSQNFFFLQESEIDSPVGTPQPPVIANQPSPPGPIPTQTFTNQHFIQVQPGRVGEPGTMAMPPQPHFAPLPEHAAYPGGVPMPLPHQPQPQVVLPPPPHVVQQPAPPPPVLSPHLVSAAPPSAPVHLTEERPAVSPQENKPDDDWIESASPERDDTGERKTHGQGDGQGRFRRFGRGSRGAPNGHRGGRGSYQGRQGGDGYRGRHGGDYQGRSNREEGGYQGRSNNSDGYQGRTYKDDGYQGRSNKDDGYQGRSNKDDGYQGRSNKDDGYQGRSNKDDGYQGRSNKDEGGYQGRSNRDDGGYRNRQYDGYQSRHKDSYQNKGTDDGYYGNGDTGDSHERREHENGGRERYGDGQNYQGGFKSRGRGGRGGPTRGSSRPPRAAHHNYNNRKQENVE